MSNFSEKIIQAGPGRSSQGEAFTLVELLVTLAVVVILAALLTPAAAGVFRAADSAKCAQTLRQLSIALLACAGDNNMTLPRSSHSAYAVSERGWSRSILPYLGERSDMANSEWAKAQAKYFRCPADKSRTTGQSYGLNVFFELRPEFDEYEGSPDQWRTLPAVPAPARSILLAEVGGSSDHVMAHFWTDSQAGGFDCAHDRHAGKANFAFVDGHVESLRLEQTFDPAAGINLWNPSLAK